MKQIVYLNDQPFLNESALAKYAQDLQPLNCSISLLTNFIYNGGSYLSKVTNKLHFKVVAVLDVGNQSTHYPRTQSWL